ncbi:hypothetical protein HELRODRAFT_185384 [Helobdella robusta]|uniref:lysoplasmalogenase n=1 Tax=Helobdella robusta TaxID=6412 RepID=T1FMR0_HELRO|nr:hypothetical protein HELRODRAFT_185384 [Helobdella robusta]ESO09013.1 hypothetical protein HELRODRAFT_185384 [Helobdella robusta]
MSAVGVRVERDKPLTVFKSVAPKMVPFMKTLAVYFILFGPAAKYESILYCIIKCLPIISLIVFVLLHGMSFSEYYSYSRKVMFGLVFCCIGDAFMVWKTCGYFMHSMFFFGLGQICYTSAFGFKPFNILAALFIGLINGAMYFFFFSGVKRSIAIFLGVYVVLLSMMVWRAVSRVRFFDDLWTWTKLCSCVGAVLFMISDFTIGIHAFYTPLYYSHQIIMTTYYAAQFGIALSVVDSQVDAFLAEEISRYEKSLKSE